MISGRPPGEKKNTSPQNRPICLLLAEVTAADIEFFQQFLESNSASAGLTVTSDGIAAIEYLESAGPLAESLKLSVIWP